MTDWPSGGFPAGCCTTGPINHTVLKVVVLYCSVISKCGCWPDGGCVRWSNRIRCGLSNGFMYPCLVDCYYPGCYGAVWDVSWLYWGACACSSRFVFHVGWRLIKICPPDRNESVNLDPRGSVSASSCAPASDRLWWKQTGREDAGSRAEIRHQTPAQRPGRAPPISTQRGTSQTFPGRMLVFFSFPLSLL